MIDWFRNVMKMFRENINLYICMGHSTRQDEEIIVEIIGLSGRVVYFTLYLILSRHIFDCNVNSLIVIK